jgi:hypothetical protein
VIVRASDSTLVDLNADSVITREVDAFNSEDTVAVRSSGYLTMADRRLWAQYCTYYAETALHAGFVVVHNVFVGADVRGRLRDDIAGLTDAVHAAFLAVTDTVDDDPPTDPLPVLQGDQDGP